MGPLGVRKKYRKPGDEIIIGPPQKYKHKYEYFATDVDMISSKCWHNGESTPVEESTIADPFGDIGVYFVQRHKFISWLAMSDLSISTTNTVISSTVENKATEGSAYYKVRASFK